MLNIHELLKLINLISISKLKIPKCKKIILKINYIIYFFLIKIKNSFFFHYNFYFLLIKNYFQI